MQLVLVLEIELQIAVAIEPDPLTAEICRPSKIVEKQFVEVVRPHLFKRAVNVFVSVEKESVAPFRNLFFDKCFCVAIILKEGLTDVAAVDSLLYCKNSSEHIRAN